MTGPCPSRSRRGTALAAASLTGLLAVAACGGTSAPGNGNGPGGDDLRQTAGDGSRYPLGVDSCGVGVQIESAPERVVLLKSAAVPYLLELGVLDRAVARAGAYPRGYYDDEEWATVEKVPLLTDRVDTTGHTQISRETVLAQDPDLVLGSADSVDTAALADVGIPLLEEPTLCADATTEPSFADVSDRLRTFGAVFDRSERAEERVTALEERVERLSARAEQVAKGRSAAVLYPTVGGGATYAYGTRSMAHSQLEAAGLANVFADVDERVFEVTAEELVSRDPDLLVLLHSNGQPGPVRDAALQLPGMTEVTAVTEDRVLVQLFNLVEPPSPLSVDGLERLVEELER
ncbi:ABC transporter substrate-binding protein [Ornithinicoccus halotolerans]|uniref:ABC transporter substrate-binding protein n=1 Tax=Ornithinicoccus halotolerans TaxID=1748220 RepID=UPI001295C654|nr:ABC transporter substrate-binding protein [Ornithinicoccus halotolerans]